MDTRAEARRLRAAWQGARRAYETACDTGADIDAHSREEQDTHDALVDYVDAHGLTGTKDDPRGLILPCGCPQDVVDGEGHQEGCELAP